MSELDQLVIDLGLDPFNLASNQVRSWTQLEREATSCTRCALATGRTKVVFGGGNADADLLFIGEAPSRHDDLQGKPFLGAVGNLLDNFLGDAGLSREDTYVTHLVKCHPTQDRLPRPEELEACRPYLVEQLARVRPRVVVTLGEFVSRVVMRRVIPLDKVAGYRFELHGATLIPTFHPADILRGDNQAMGIIRRDVRAAKAVLDGRLATAGEALAELRARQAEA